MNFNQFVTGILAVVAIIVVAMALSENETAAKLIQYGLIVAIIAILLRQQQNKGAPFVNAWNNIQKMALGVTQQAPSS